MHAYARDRLPMPKAEDTAPPGDGRNWGIRDLMHLQNVLLLLSGTSLDRTINACARECIEFGPIITLSSMHNSLSSRPDSLSSIKKLWFALELSLDHPLTLTYKIIQYTPLYQSSSSN